MPGGLYDQNPMFLDRVLYIMGKEGEEHERQEAKRKREANRGAGNKALRAGSRRGR